MINMGRRHGNRGPVAKTTWAISLDLDKLVARHKPRRDSIDEFVLKVFQQWLEWRDTISFMEDAYEKQSKIVEGYVKQINDLKQQLQQTEGIIANK
jgi:predicted metalloprotease with PDZ domain